MHEMHRACPHLALLLRPEGADEPLIQPAETARMARAQLGTFSVDAGSSLLSVTTPKRARKKVQFCGYGLATWTTFQNLLVNH